MQQPDPKRNSVVVLARLWPSVKKPRSRKELLKSIGPLVGGSAEQAWSAAVKEGWVEEKSRRLSERGREELRTRLGFEVLPKVRDWKSAQGMLARAALGIERDADFAAGAVCAVHDLGKAKTLAGAVDRLAWRQLGVETDAPFRALDVQRHLLKHLVPADARLEAESFRRMVATRALGAPNLPAMQSAAVKRWLADTKAATIAVKPEKAAPPMVVPKAPENSNRGETSLDEFAAAVTAAARRPGVTRFHDDRAFIGSIWENMRGRAPVFDMPLDQFKEKLVAAHRQRLLRMSRADLVQAMDPAEVARSEARYMSATFHFVALSAGGAR